MEKTKSAFTAACGVVLLIVTSHVAAAAETAAKPISFQRQVLEFAPTRPDLTVGIAWFTVLTPGKDWSLKLDQTQKGNLKDQGDLKLLDLKQIGKNRFELPALTIEPEGEKSGAVCMSIKIWFNELPNERIFFFEKVEDRYSQLSYCSQDVPEAQHHFSQNRVATLEEFRECLKKPLVLKLMNNGTPWRPRILVDRQGDVYFHSLLVGRFPAVGQTAAWGVPGPLSSHREQVWKLSSDGKLKELPLPSLVPVARQQRARQWAERVRRLADDRYGTLISIAMTEAMDCDKAGNIYTELVTFATKDSQELVQIAKVDADGQLQALAGSTPGHKDGPAKQAQFSKITALTVGPTGDIYVADGTPDTGSWVRRIAPDGSVKTIAGNDKVGFADGKGDAALFYCPSELAADASGNVYVADPVNSRVRKITSDGLVTTVVGGEKGAANDEESFAQPSGVALGPSGDLYVLDGAPKMARIRRIHQNGKIETLMVIDEARERENAGAAKDK